MDKLDIAKQFIAQFEKSWPANFDETLDALAEDCYYQMVVPTIEPVRGRAAIREALIAMKVKVLDQRHDMVSIAASGDFVFTERVDYSLRKDEWVPVPLVAVFQINDEGKIYAWREYLDLYNNLKNHGLSFEEMETTLQNL